MAYIGVDVCVGNLALLLILLCDHRIPRAGVSFERLPCQLQYQVLGHNSWILEPTACLRSIDPSVIHSRPGLDRMISFKFDAWGD